MDLTNFFSNEEYIDSRHYPEGFHNSADFSEPEADILRFCGKVVISLIGGELAPRNIDQKRVVEVLSGQRIPQFYMEKVFLKYFELTKNNCSNTSN